MAKSKPKSVKASSKTEKKPATPPKKAVATKKATKSKADEKKKPATKKATPTKSAPVKKEVKKKVEPAKKKVAATKEEVKKKKAAPVKPQAKAKPAEKIIAAKVNGVAKNGASKPAPPASAKSTIALKSNIATKSTPTPAKKAEKISAKDKGAAAKTNSTAKTKKLADESGENEIAFKEEPVPVPIKLSPADRKAFEEKLLIKRDILNKCIELQAGVVNTAKRAMDEAQESANEEKGSTEEKFDSFRESMQITRDMYARQLQEAIDGLALLKRIVIVPLMESVKLGAVVHTNLQNYFISASLGEIEHDENNYMAISTQTPIYQIIAGKKKGDIFVFRDQKYRILEIF